METIEFDKAQLPEINPERLKELLAGYGIENGEVINIELRGDKVILHVAIYGDSIPTAVIENIDGLLVAHTAIVGAPDTVVRDDREERLRRLSR
jgi:hypothetical protein